MGYPNGQAQTSIAPLAAAPKRPADGWALAALRKALVPASVESAIQQIIDAGNAEKLTKEQFLAALPATTSDE
jgi:hypothetical protein